MLTRVALVMCTFIVLSLVSSCSVEYYFTQGVSPNRERGALPNSEDYFDDKAARIVYPEQNWSIAETLWFYNTTQGSNLMDYDIFVNLSLANNEHRLFRSNENISKYRYLLQGPTYDNPDALPVGWVKNSFEGNDYIGFTCAACHTTQVNYKGVGIRIDGGPTMADAEMMLLELEAALGYASNEKQFEILAERVLQEKSTDPKKRLDLRNRLHRDRETIRHDNNMDAPIHNVKQNGILKDVHVSYGYGRLDAFGRIFNRVSTQLAPPGMDLPHPATAPVSYPFLWDTPRMDYVQWNGIGNNGGSRKLGSLGRNTGEALGVFATFELVKEDPSWFSRNIVGADKLYHSSVMTWNQVRLEESLIDLWSPSWEQLAEANVLPKIDTALKTGGEEVYKKYKCYYCHEVIDRTSSKNLKAEFTSVDIIQTDPAMAHNALNYCTPNGVFKDSDKEPGDISGNACKLEKQHSSNPPPIRGKYALERVVEGVLKNNVFTKVWTYLVAIVVNPIKEAPRHLDFQTIEGTAPEKTLYAYKGRPLNGIWATAPYLHNGSVPNLYELLLPSCSREEVLRAAECRSNTFTVGNRELDTVKVGFVQLKPEKYTKPSLFVFDTSLPGNSNKGHEFASGKTPVIKLDADRKPLRNRDGGLQVEILEPISDQERWALIEYLKTL
jgi:hypothetical protein